MIWHFYKYKKESVSLMLYVQNDNKKCFRIPTMIAENRLYAVETGYNKVEPGKKQCMTRDVYIMHYVISGKGTFMNQSFSGGDGYLVVANEKEEIKADIYEPYESFWIMFKGDGAKEVLSKCGLPEHNSVFKFEHTKECADLIGENLKDISHSPLAESAKMNAVFYSILAIHLDASEDFSPADKSDITKNIARFISENYLHTIKINELAKKYYISQSHLIALFNKRYGLSPQEYLISVRIKRAKKLLQDSSITVKEAAVSVGIENPLYFSRLFKKKTGLSPSDFRRRMAQL